MTTVSPTPEVVEVGLSHSGVKHWYCCSPRESYCGMDVSDEHECDDGCGCLPCAMCEADAYIPCRTCGGAG